MSILVEPPSFEMATTETWPLGFDFTNLMSPGDAVSGVSVLLVDLNFSTSAVLIGASHSGNVVMQVLAGTSLLAGHKYRLEVTATLNTDKVATLPLIVRCDF